VLAVVLGMLAAASRPVDAIVGVLIDLALSLPHLVLLILVSFVLGGGTFGVIIAVIVSHWPSLARVVRAEMREVLAADYIAVARCLGSRPLVIALRHVLPHVLPRALVGAVLLVPHAILHEAGLTFLGFGIEPHLPATGTLLSEAMRHVSSGHWWLGVWPGASLLAMVLTFERLAAGARLWLDPRRAQT
jgi:peptide/nickel transport system permease protein